MKNIRYFRVVPKLPPRLLALKTIAENLLFAWNQDAINLFHRIDPELWEEAAHNPVRFLGLLRQQRLTDILTDEGFLSEMDRVAESFQHYLSAHERYDFNLDNPPDFQIAYFSAEYGLNEALPLYSGGLGILSGEHLKSASDLSLPVYGIGLLYQMGYFQQYLNNDGWQQESYLENDFFNMPVSVVRKDDKQPLMIEVDLAGTPLKAKIWKIRVGRIPLFVLDTNISENPTDLRGVTSQLYGGDLEMRMRQEILLGIGGVRAIRALGLTPSVYHMNEGHSAFASLERIRLLMEENAVSFDEAREAVSASNVFTTHTPVPAGNDTFPRHLLEKYLGGYAQKVGLSFPELMKLGKQHPDEPMDPFCMTVLALRLSSHCNGVSRLHSTVSRRMWHSVWPRFTGFDVPIDHITNGVHIASWISHEMAALYHRYLGPNWSVDPDNQRVWERIDRIPDSELWRTHERRREQLVAYARRRLQQQLIRRAAPSKEVALAAEVLNPEILTIGFARRFATYKRGNLIFRDPGRLAGILNHSERPVQIIIAGKAHPMDNPGKEIIRQIIHLIRRDEFRHRVVFLEDYDMNLARYLVQGVDIWLNNPRRPLEACGTSGMKVTPNGGLNLSILDGWWDEGFDGENGWAIGSGEEYSDHGYQDEVESEAIYSLLEKDIAPLFYDRGRDNLPRGWIQKMKHAMQTLIPVFNTHRMVEEYMSKYYVNAARNWKVMTDSKMENAITLSRWKTHITGHWSNIRIVDVQYNHNGDFEIGASVTISAELELGELTPHDVSVHAYYGPLDATGNFVDRETVILVPTVSGDRTGRHVFQGKIPCARTGRFGFVIRVLPAHELLTNPVAMNLVLWG